MNIERMICLLCLWAFLIQIPKVGCILDPDPGEITARSWMSHRNQMRQSTAWKPHAEHWYNLANSGSRKEWTSMEYHHTCWTRLIIDLETWGPWWIGPKIYLIQHSLRTVVRQISSGNPYKEKVKVITAPYYVECMHNITGILGGKLIIHFHH